jgi:hypothetical protein
MSKIPEIRGFDCGVMNVMFHNVDWFSAVPVSVPQCWVVFHNIG